MKSTPWLSGVMAAGILMVLPVARADGDNRDDARSGKVDRVGDGNSGQGDDLRRRDLTEDGRARREAAREGKGPGECCQDRDRFIQFLKNHPGIREELRERCANLSEEDREVLRQRVRERFAKRRQEWMHKTPEEKRAWLKERGECRRKRREEFLRNHPEARDRFEDRRDRREDIRDERHDGGPRDRVEDRRDRREDRREDREDRRDPRHEGKERPEHPPRPEHPSHR